MSNWLRALLMVGVAAVVAAFAIYRLQSATDWAKIDAIPPDNLAEFTKAHLDGLGQMERFDYPKAIVAFQKAHDLAPGLIASSINLAIATLNDTGTQEAKKVAAGGQVEIGKFERAIALLDQVLAREPDNLYAHYCRGIILQYVANFELAHADFVAVTQKDPSDASAWMYLGVTMGTPEGTPEERKKFAETLVQIYTKAVERNPYHVQALFRLQRAQILSGRRDAYEATAEIWRKLNRDELGNPQGPGDPGQLVYGEMGKYATIINPFTRMPDFKTGTLAPKFDLPHPIDVRLAEGERWVKEQDFLGKQAVLGRARARFGAAIVALDADGDDRLDLYFASAVVGQKGIRDVLLLNKGDNKYVDGSRAFGLPEDLASLSVSAGDFDADRHVDLFVTGIGERHLFRNDGGKTFADRTDVLAAMGPSAISPSARWADLDQDGDLDLYVVNYTDVTNADSAFTEKTPPGLKNSAYRNDGVPPASDGPRDAWSPIGVSKNEKAKDEGLSLKFTPWSDAPSAPLLGTDAPHTGVSILDVDEDRDLDLILSEDGGKAASVVLNDRLGRFHAGSAEGLGGIGLSSGLLTIDLDRDGVGDLVSTSKSGKVFALRNSTTRDGDGVAHIQFSEFPLDARNWRAALVADVDLDGATDLLGLPAENIAPAPIFARSEGARLLSSVLILGPDGVRTYQGMAYADTLGDPLPDVIGLRDGDGPRVSKNLGNGNRWIGLQLGGRWDVKPKNMRTNVQGLGARVTIQGDGLFVAYDHTTPEAGPSQSVTPVVLGIGKHDKARLVRLKWPDGLLQCELDEDADRVVPLVETNRKTGSCPVLFTWDGKKMVCLGDFLGGGGLGYLVEPGVYGEPDRDEGVPIGGDQLTPAGGKYRMSIAEPMDELAYLDRISLDVVDRPPGVSSGPEERFAPGGNRPSGRLLAWREEIEPILATDLKGRDVAAALLKVDRQFVDDFKRLQGWIGYAETHGMVLDFGDRLATLGVRDRVALVLVGATEYPYSQTNYAASTAGVTLKPPLLERARPDGSWEVIEPDPGYPAGMERMTLLDLTGKLSGPTCKLRLKTNMDIVWDRAFIAPIAENAGIRVTSLPVEAARLHRRGYLREISPDGHPPLTYDYDNVDPAPLAPLVGKLTRYGDVTPLLTVDDDQLCVIGPGDEARLEFDAEKAPPLQAGWTRSFVLRSIGYCKDADPFTAASDAVGPLPWRGMPAYPFGPEGERPRDQLYETYLRTYQNRSVGR